MNFAYSLLNLPHTAIQRTAHTRTVARGQLWLLLFSGGPSCVCCGVSIQRRPSMINWDEFIFVVNGTEGSHQWQAQKHLRPSRNGEKVEEGLPAAELIEWNGGRRCAEWDAINGMKLCSLPLPKPCKPTNRHIMEHRSCDRYTKRMWHLFSVSILGISIFATQSRYSHAWQWKATSESNAWSTTHTKKEWNSSKWTPKLSRRSRTDAIDLSGKSVCVAFFFFFLSFGTQNSFGRRLEKVVGMAWMIYDRNEKKWNTKRRDGN